MRFRIRLSSRLARPWLAGLTAAWLAGCGMPMVPAFEVLPAPAAMRALGVPALPLARLAAIQRYSMVSGHAFVAWHPTAAEMLVSHNEARTAQLYRLRDAMAAPEPLTDGADPVRVADWDPTGRYVVFARSQGGDEAYQLFRLDPETRATVQITPDGQRHTLLGWVRTRGLALVSSVPLDRAARDGRHDDVATTITLVDPLQPEAGRVVTRLPGGGWFGAEVAPDDASLAITRFVSATESEVWSVELASGERRRLLPAAGETLVATHAVGQWARDGSALYVASDRAGEFRELMRLDRASHSAAALARLTQHITWNVEDGSLSADGRLLALRVNVDGRDELRVLDAESGRDVAMPTRPPGSVARVAFHPRLPLLAVAVSSAQGPSQIHVIDFDRQQVRPWTRARVPSDLALDRLPDPEVVRWTTFDGRTLSGILHRPPGHFTGPRPVVMVMHGGPASQAKLGWAGRWNYLTQELGVAVFEPNVRGSSGYGKSFVALDDGYRREDSVRDMGSALDWITTRPDLDAQRVLVAGGSYGGYMALAASVHFADRIAGAASMVGISNFVSFLENTESYRRDLRRAEYGDERDPRMRAFLQRISPLTQAHRIVKPLLVAQGRNDPRVPWTESEQIVRRLQRSQAPVWYLLADNEGHGFAKRENADYYFVAFVGFVERVLLY